MAECGVVGVGVRVQGVLLRVDDNLFAVGGCGCDFACDWHKDPQDLKKRLARGLASEEWVSTQREGGAYDGYYDDY